MMGRALFHRGCLATLCCITEAKIICVIFEDVFSHLVITVAVPLVGKLKKGFSDGISGDTGT